MLLDLVSGERAAEAFEVAAAADGDYHMAMDTNTSSPRSNSRTIGNISSSLDPSAVTNYTRHSSSNLAATRRGFKVDASSVSFEQELRQQSPSPAGAAELCV